MQMNILDSQYHYGLTATFFSSEYFIATKLLNYNTKKKNNKLDRFKGKRYLE